MQEFSIFANKSVWYMPINWRIENHVNTCRKSFSQNSIPIYDKNSPESRHRSNIRQHAAAAKSHKSCPTLCNPIDSSPPGSPIPGILQARTVEWVATSFSSAWKGKVKVKSLSHVGLLATPWTAAYQAPQSMGFSRQEYWSGVPSPSPTSTQKKPYTINPQQTLSSMAKNWKHFP